MTSYILIALVLGISLGIWFGRRKKVPALIARQGREKEDNLATIMNAMESRGKMSNDDVEKLLGVSDATATRYMEELEKDGKVRQAGTEGKYVYYERVN